VKRILTVLTVALVMVAMVALVAAPAFAAPPSKDKPGNGHPVKTQSGQCPAGLNKDTSPGGMKKC
jgi:cytochrome c-type biogenesis protein CcmH/NrfG